MEQSVKLGELCGGLLKKAAETAFERDIKRQRQKQIDWFNSELRLYQAVQRQIIPTLIRQLHGGF